MRHNHKEEHRCDSGHSCCADEHKCCCCGDIDVSGHNHDDGEQNAARRWIPVGISLFMLVLGLVFTYYEIAFFGSYVRFIWFLTAYLVVALPVLRQMVREFTNRDFFNEFSLMSLATIGAFCIGEYPEAVGVMLFYTVGEIVQDMAVRRATGSIKALLDVRPETACVRRNGIFVETSPQDVSVGDVIRVKVGDKVPLDGTMLSEKSSFDTSVLTGESVPRTVRAGESVLAGMLNIEYVSDIRVDKAYEESALARILYMTQSAVSRKAKAELFIRKFAKIYTPIVFGLALAITLLPSLFVVDYVFADWFYRGLVFLVVSCPCALVISVPLGYFSGIGLASKNGILFKGANYLETLTKLTHIAFDKTGTLTKGTFSVKNVESRDITEDELVAMAATVEKHSNHPIARAIVAFAQNLPLDEYEATELKEIAGQGLQAVVENKRILVGNGKLLKNNNISYDEAIDDIVETRVLVGIDNRFVGYMIIADEVRREASGLIAKLRHTYKIHTVMLSGDSEPMAQKVGSDIGIDEIYGGLLPENKVEVIERIKSDNGSVVAYFGDGINDSPALALSDVGIAMGSLGSQAAIEIADIVIQTDDITAIADAIKIAGITQRVVIQNIVLALGIKFIIMLLAVLGFASMWLAVFADVGVALLAILNSVRIIFKKI